MAFTTRAALRSTFRRPAGGRWNSVKSVAGSQAARHLHSLSSARLQAAKVSPAELTKILSERIEKFSDAANVEEVGRVLNVGDGIARVYGLKSVKAGK